MKNEIDDVSQQIFQQERVLVRSEFYIKDLDSLSQDIHSEDLLKIHYGITGIRKIVSVIDVIQYLDKSKYIQAVIDKNIIPKIIELIKQNAHPLIVKEAAWTISNLLSGTKEQCDYILLFGAFQTLLDLLYYKQQDIAEQALWGLANIIPDGPQYADIIINHIDQIGLIYQNAKLDGQQVCIWAVSNIIKFMNRDSKKLAKKCLPIIYLFIKHESSSYDLIYDSYELLYDLCQIIDKDGIQQIFTLEIFPLFIKNLNYESQDRIIITIISILETLLVYEENIMDNISTQIPILLGHHNLKIRKDVKVLIIKTLNLLMKFNHKKQINQEDINTIQKICLIIQQDDLDTKKQAIKVMINYFKNPQFSVIITQTKTMIISLIIPFLNYQKLSEFLEIFDLLEQFLQLGEFHKKLLSEYQIDDNPCLIELQKQGGIENLEQLQLHENDQVYKRVIKILTLIDKEAI